jgi:hypothetical protein
MEYIVPKYKELEQLGYIPTGNLFEPNDILYSALTSYGSPYRDVSIQYLQRYKSFRQITIRVLAGYGYGLDNLQQFGNSTEYLLRSAITLGTRNIVSSVYRQVERGKYITCSYSQMNKIIDQIELPLKQYCVRKEVVV